jgi:hypothetical protein
METILSFKSVQMIFMPESWNDLIHDDHVKPQLFDSLDWIAISSDSLIDFMNCIRIKNRFDYSSVLKRVC